MQKYILQNDNVTNALKRTKVNSDESFLQQEVCFKYKPLKFQ